MFLGCPVDSLRVVLSIIIIPPIFVKEITIGVVEATPCQLVKAILVVLPRPLLNILSVERFLIFIINIFSFGSRLMNSLIIIVSAFRVKSPLIEEVSLCVIETAISKYIEFVVVVFTRKSFDLFLRFFRLFNHYFS